MDTEFKVNNGIREYLEKSYRMIYDQLDNKHQYYGAEDVEEEKERREVYAKGATDEAQIRKV